MANASASKGRRTKRRTTRKKSGSRVWPWVVALVGVAGGITAYEHGDQLRRWTPTVFKTAPARLLAATESRLADRPAPAVPIVHPVPRAPVTGVPMAAAPVSKPEAGELVGKNFHGTFYFCGTSGLDNCVADGDVFWFRKQAIRLADISAPASQNARCDGERAKGFAAKVRLRDLLNDGTFELADWPNKDEDGQGRKLRVVMRNGQSIGAQLAREGLVRTASDGGRTWCS
ncbi:thermonuclease family protein [Rhizobium sp. SAFR-030]|uniref:thermonuclease family protein n=1 Tax=Rhizobium sp. SAFR-030 TaxID=3387277 RepID=UPI003F815286